MAKDAIRAVEQAAARHGLNARLIAEDGLTEFGYWEFVTTADGKGVADSAGNNKKIARNWPSNRAAEDILNAFVAKLEAEGR